MWKTLVASALLVVAGANAQAQQPIKNQAVYATEFQAPPEFHQWYWQTERCLGQRGNFNKILWAVTPEPWNQKISSDNPNKDFSATFGMWTNLDSLRSMIILTKLDWQNEFYVKHEMIHDIMWRNGWSAPPGLADVEDSVNVRRAHPAPPYEKCAPTYITQMRTMQAQRESPYKQVYRP